MVVRNNGLTHDDKPDRGFDPLEQFVGALGVHTVRAAHRDMPNALGRNVFPTPTAPVLAVTSLRAAVVSAEVRVYHGALRKARRGRRAYKKTCRHPRFVSCQAARVFWRCAQAVCSS